MPCYHPQNVIRSKRVCHRKSGKPVIFFNKSYLKYRKLWNDDSYRDYRNPDFRMRDYYEPDEFQVPGCSPKCLGCQEDYSRQWAVRAWHHSMKHKENAFITLTFNDKYVPRELDHSIWQRFMKRLRRAISQPVSMFMAGEYGSKNFRPHFHACIFGFGFPDRVLWSVRNGVQLYTSAFLGRLWSDPKTGESFGFSSVGDVTFESAAYIARYVGKKSQRSVEELDGRKPEYSKCSLKRPIGKDWFLSYKSSVYPDDAVTLVSGRKVKPPRYYDKLLALTNPDLLDSIKHCRKEKAIASPDNTPARLLERESVKKAQFLKLKRGL